MDLEVWALDRQHQSPANLDVRVPGPSPATCVLTRPPGDSDTPWRWKAAGLGCQGVHGGKTSIPTLT